MRLRLLPILAVTVLAALLPMQSASGHEMREARGEAAAFAAYFSDGTSKGLLGMDAMADPQPLTGKGNNMRIVANLPLEGSVAASDLELHGDYAYIGSYGEGMVIVDISDPENPKRAGVFPCAGGQNDVQLSPDANYGVMAVETTANECHPDDEGVVVLDLRDKTQPKEIAWIGEDAGLVDGAHNVTLDWPNLYVDQYTQTYARFEIFDLSNPAEPKSIAKLPAPEGGAHDLQVDHRPDGKVLAYAASIAFTHVIDVTDPKNPSFVNRVPAAEHGVGISHGAEPNHDRTLMIETDEYGGGSGVGGCGSRSEGVPPIVAGQIAGNLPAGSVHFLRLNPDGTLKELGDGKVDQAGGYNTPLATTGNTSDGCTSHVFWQAPNENRMTIAWYQRGTRIVDFSDPAAPVELGYFEATGGEAWSAKPHKGYIFVGDTKRGLDVLQYTGEECKKWPTTAGAAEVQRARYQGATPPDAPAFVEGDCDGKATNVPPIPGNTGQNPNQNQNQQNGQQQGGQTQQQGGQQQGGGKTATAVGGYRFLRVVKARGKARRATVRLQILDASGKVVATRKYRVKPGKRTRIRAAIGGPVGRYAWRIRQGKRTLKGGSFTVKTASKIRVSGASAQQVRVGRLAR